MEGSVSEISSGHGRQGVARPRVARQEAPAMAQPEAQKPPESNEMAYFSKLMDAPRPQDLPIAAKYAAEYVLANVGTIASADAKKMSAMLRGSGQGGPVELAVQALEARINQPEAGAEGQVEMAAEAPAQTIETPPVISAETEQALAEVEHINDMVDMLDDGKQGSFLELAKKLPGWEQKLASLPPGAYGNKLVEQVYAKLRRLTGQAELAKMKSEPKYRN